MKKLLLKTMLLLCALVAGMSSAWAEDEKFYTLTPKTGTNNSYAGDCDVDVDGITWNLTGNSTLTPWRIGGKSLSNVDRALYSKTAISENVSKIEVTHGAASNITVNSWTVIVATDAEFTNIVSTLTPSFEASTTTTINRPAGKDWTNCYYKFVYNVTVEDKNSNKYLQFSEAKFYKDADSGSSDPVAVTGVSLNKTSLELEVDGTETLTATVAPNNASNKGVNWTSSDEDVATVADGVVTAVAVGTATITVTTDEGDFSASCNVTVREAKNYTTLPFNWEGGISSDFTSLEGVTVNGLGSDYAAGNAPYRIKFDNTGDYIQIKTDSQIGKVSIDVKMIGGKDASSITVKESTDGTEFTDVQTLSISGKQNDILSLETTNAFASTSRYIRLVFTKGSNVGVGPISVEKGITITSAGYATLYTPVALDFSGVDGLTAYTAVKDGDVVRLTQVSNVPANTGVVLEGAAGTYSIPAIATSTTAKGELTGNATAPTAYNAESGITYYVLASTGSGVEFRPVSEGEIAAGKAFLKVTGSGVHSYSVAFGDETGISEAVSDVKAGAIYDLSGRRVVKPTRGLYIVNGKKIMVK